MAKDRSEKKEKKEKKVSDDGVKKEKKEKKEKRKSAGAIEAAADDTMIDATEVEDATMADGDDAVVVAGDIPKSALVPFANPLCDEKNGKKVLKTVKKGALFYDTCFSNPKAIY